MHRLRVSPSLRWVSAKFQREHQQGNDEIVLEHDRPAGAGSSRVAALLHVLAYGMRQTSRASLMLEGREIEPNSPSTVQSKRERDSLALLKGYRHSSWHQTAPVNFVEIKRICSHNLMKWLRFDFRNTIYYRCEYGHSPVSTSCVTIWNPNSLSSSETGVNPEIKSWKKDLYDWARCQKAIGGIYFTKKWRAETRHPGLEFDNFKPRLKSGIFNRSPDWTVRFFGVDDRGFLKEGVKTYLMASMSSLNSPTFFLSSHL